MDYNEEVFNKKVKMGGAFNLDVENGEILKGFKWQEAEYDKDMFDVTAFYAGLSWSGVDLEQFIVGVKPKKAGRGTIEFVYRHPQADITIKKKIYEIEVEE